MSDYSSGEETTAQIKDTAPQHQDGDSKPEQENQGQRLIKTILKAIYLSRIALLIRRRKSPGRSLRHLRWMRRGRKRKKRSMGQIFQKLMIKFPVRNHQTTSPSKSSLILQLPNLQRILKARRPTQSKPHPPQALQRRRRRHLRPQTRQKKEKEKTPPPRQPKRRRRCQKRIRVQRTRRQQEEEEA